MLRIHKAIEHNMRHRCFLGMFIFIDSGKIQCKFSRHIHIFLNSFILRPKIIFPITYVKQPMHGFNAPFHQKDRRNIEPGELMNQVTRLMKTKFVKNHEGDKATLVAETLGVSGSSVARTIAVDKKADKETRKKLS